jgi:hypothetical protein
MGVDGVAARRTYKKIDAQKISGTLLAKRKYT